MSNDGLSDDEIIKLLFKNYMNSTTTSDGKLFYEETLLSSNSNIFSSGILIDTPPVYTTDPLLHTVTSAGELTTYLSYSAIPDISINDSWFNEKTQEGSFSVNSTDDNNRIILRLESIKLDYLGGGSAAFVCNDNNGVNILQNLIPSNYSTSGYSISLQYKHNNTLKSVGWLATRSDLAGSAFIGSSVNFGGALFDTKNGVVTFYDVNGTESDIFSNAEFYLSATKYIGLNNINVLRFLEVIGDVSMQSDLDVSNTLSVHNNLFVDSDVSLGSHLQVVGDVSMETNLDISSNLHVKGNATFGVVSSNAEDVSNNDSNVYVYGDLKIMDGGNIDVVGELTVEDNLTYNGTLLKGDQDIISMIDSSLTNLKNSIETITGGSEAIDLATIESKLEDITHDGSTTIIDGDVSINNNLIIGGNTNFIGDANFGSSSTDVSLVLYGELKIKAGGNLVIEDSSFSITKIHTDVKITDILDISNDGTGPALIVRQYDTSAQDIARFMDGDTEVFVIGNNGQTEIAGDVYINSVLDVSGTITTDKQFTLKTNSTEKAIIDTSGVKIVNSDPSYSALDISATSALRIPVGTNTERPSIQSTGQIRYNTSTKQFEGYGDSGTWQGLGGIIDVDQDTFILAETNPDADNDQIQIFTAGSERMKVDACGNIQMMNSNPDYSALDISATSALQIPVGTEDQRPKNSENPGALRFNSDTSLCEIYTQSNIWSGIPLYKAEQPPKMHSPSTTEENKRFTISWSKFDEIYKDAYDGKSYPIFLQTYVDVSYSGTSNQWKTIYIGPGNCNSSGNAATPSLDLSINDSGFSFDDNDGTYSRDDIDFNEKPDVHSISSFDQNYKFDFRVYAVNNSGKTPNYLYIEQVGLKTTNEPSPPEVTSTHTFTQNSFTIDTSFNVDSGDSSVTINEVTIDHYDVSYLLTDTKSFETRTHSSNSEISHLTKTGIPLSGLYPGAVYDFQVQVKNTANTNESGYGDVFTSTEFTHDSSNQYIILSDLDSVDIDNMTFTKYNFSDDISLRINDGGSSRTKYMLGNSNSYIDISGTSEFYVNYGLQGLDMSGESDMSLVEATFTIKEAGSSVSSQTLTYYGTHDPSGVSPSTINVFTPLSEQYFVVTVSNGKYFIDGVETPILNFVVGVTYKFDQSDSTNSGHPLRFYEDINKTNEYTTDVITNGTPGTAGAYTQITITSQTPESLYYQCSAHLNMGNEAQISSLPEHIYQFSSGGTYTDKASSLDYNGGFVYSATFYRSDDNSLNSIFNDNFKPSTNSYELLYDISSSSTQTNGASYIDNTNTTTGNTTTGNISTDTFYVDDYSMNPVITFTTPPSLSTTATYLFGIPSVDTMSIDYDISISDFANYFIPSNGSGVHSGINEISGNSYTITPQTYNSTNSNDTYNINATNLSVTVNNATNTGYYDADTSDNLSVYVYYLDHNSGAPSLKTQDASSEIYDIGHIFINSERTYSDYSLYTFDGVNTITSISDVSNSSFATTSPMDTDISTTLLRFDGKFVSGSYSTTYNGVTITPFSDWTSSGGGYAEGGPNYSSYSNTGIDGFKWIAIDINGLLPTAGNDDDGRIYLSSFKVNGNSVNGGGTYSIESSNTGYDNHFSDISNDDGWIAFLYITPGDWTNATKELFTEGQWGALHKTFKASSGETSYWELGYSDPKEAVGASSSDSFTTLTTTNLGIVSGAIAGTTGTDYPGLDSNNIAYGKIPKRGSPDFWDGNVYLVVGLPKGKNSYFTF